VEELRSVMVAKEAAAGKKYQVRSGALHGMHACVCVGIWGLGW
jgi:hypothetical protein